MTPSERPRLWSSWGKGLIYVGIIVVTLGALDLVLVLTGMFAPPYSPGDPVLGWRSAPPADSAYLERCPDPANDRFLAKERNELGFRTNLGARELREFAGGVLIAVTGDSQTDLCAPNDSTHPGVLQAELRERGVDASVVAFGAGRYSPLQSYLAFREHLRPFEPDVFVLNVYLGNDFNDLLRVDDRPYLVRDGDRYRVEEPQWFRHQDPARPPRSRVAFMLRSLADATGARELAARAGFLAGAAREHGAGTSQILWYFNDLRRASNPDVGYPDAFNAEMLNQQLFFHHFPRSREESVTRMRAIMAQIRRENPELTLVLSPIPSYQLLNPDPMDPTLPATLERLPLSLEDGIAEEAALYELLRDAADALGWLFVDDLPLLRAYEGPARLYNSFDYHLTPEGSRIIGQAQADLIRPLLDSLPEAPRHVSEEASLLPRIQWR